MLIFLPTFYYIFRFKLTIFWLILACMRTILRRPSVELRQVKEFGYLNVRNFEFLQYLLN